MRTIHAARKIIKRKGETMAIDPVCKMEVDEKSAEIKSTYKGESYYFCAPGCKKAFDESPENYAGGGKPKGCCGC